MIRHMNDATPAPVNSLREAQLRAISSDVRMTILRLLRNPAAHFSGQLSADPVAFGVCMSLIAEALGIAQPTASRHLDLLRQAGFLKVRRQGKWSYCRRDETAIRDFLAWLKRDLDG